MEYLVCEYVRIILQNVGHCLRFKRFNFNKGHMLCICRDGRQDTERGIGVYFRQLGETPRRFNLHSDLRHTVSEVSHLFSDNVNMFVFVDCLKFNSS
jgi:hypothetical protein